jgi:hypothetical protein
MPSFRPVLVGLALASAACLLPTTPAQAGPGVKAAEKVRKALGEPTAERNLAFAGDLWEGGTWKGSLRVSVEAHTHDETMAWVSKEEWKWLGGAGDRNLTVTATLAADLTLLQLEVARRHGKKEEMAFVVREGETMKGTAREIVNELEGEGKALSIPWAKDTLAGLGAVALLARAHVTPGAGPLEVRWVPTHLWTEASLPAARTLVMTAPEAGAPGVLTLTTAPGLTGGAAGASTSLLKLEDQATPVLGWTALDGSADLLPVGRLPVPDTFDENKPARVWQHAFRTFGVGYHMAKPELVDKAFDWQALHDYESSVEDGWPVEKPVSELRDAWIAEFMAQSKHRNRRETDDLLAGTIGTGTVTVRSPDHVVLAAIAQFGGGEARTYHLKRGPDGIWRLTRFG